MTLAPFQRRLKLSRVALGVIVVLLIFLLIKRIHQSTEDVLDQNLRSLKQLSELYQSQQSDVDDEDFSSELNRLVEKSRQKLKEEEKERKQQQLLKKGKKKTGKCPSYLDYSQVPHAPYTDTKLRLPFQRPSEPCRTFSSPSVESLIEGLLLRLEDPDIARLTENALPNTLDTTILYHSSKDPARLETFVVTGDIHAEWLRDSARQLSIYQGLTKSDPKLATLIKGAIKTQARYVKTSPYCNAFHPPAGSGVSRGETAFDEVTPRPNWQVVFECKWEVDSLASFLTLTREYYDVTKDISVFDKDWFDAMQNLVIVLRRETSPTFDKDGNVLPFYYTFKRNTNVGTETLPLAGLGNPVNFDIGLVRSAFRPSDDATIFQFFIPGNAYLQVELEHITRILNEVQEELNKQSIIHSDKLQILIDSTGEMAVNIKKGIYEYGVVEHPKWGKVFAYEVDGYGGANFMDDANIPSLLSLPDLGFIDKNDEIYQNTRKMILNKSGNPYYLQGSYFKGIGGPHIGIHNAWPMSLLMQIRTTDNDEEILENLELIKTTTAGLGLIHESIHVNSFKGQTFTRPWFSWANSEFGKTILDLAERKPYLIFKDKFKDEKFTFDSLKGIQN